MTPESPIKPETPKLVVINDDEQYIKLFAYYLSKEKLLGKGQAAFFTDLEKAESFFKKEESKTNPPKLIVLDFTMNDNSTIDLLEELKGEESPYKNTFVVVTTTLGDPFFRDTCLDSGANQVIGKTPKERESLIALLKVKLSP